MAFDVTQCTLVGTYQCFGEMFYHQLQDGTGPGKESGQLGTRTRKLVMSQRNGLANQNYDWGKVRKEGSQHTLMGRLSPEMATTPSPCFTPISFTAVSFNNHYQFTPLLNSCPLIFGLMLFRWFISVYLSFF
jgi:hypothetical protein